MKVYKTQCKNCLLSPDSIVSPARRKQIIKKCTSEQTFFVCHKSSIQGDEDVCCKTYFDRLGHHSQMIRIAGRLGMIQEIEQEETEKLPTWAEMQKKDYFHNLPKEISREPQDDLLPF
jgi:hypothetical protein